MIQFALLVVTIMATIPSPKSLGNEVRIPMVDFQYNTDEWSFNEQVKIDIDPKDLNGLAGAQARLFPSLYVADPDEPSQISISKTTSHCKIFKARILPFSPNLETPFVRVGALENADLRCVGGHLAQTVCYLVITKDTMGSRIQLEPGDVDDYFAYSYRFTVKVPPNRPCSTGTEAADRQDEKQRKENPVAFRNERRVSVQQQRQLAEVDGPKVCVKIRQ